MATNRGLSEAKKFERAIGPHLAELFRSAVQRALDENRWGFCRSVVTKKTGENHSMNVGNLEEMRGVHQQLVGI